MHGQLDSLDTLQDLIIHLDGKVGRAVWIIVLSTKVRIDEQTEVWIIKLNDRHTFLRWAFTEVVHEDGFVSEPRHVAFLFVAQELVKIAHADFLQEPNLFVITRG